MLYDEKFKKDINALMESHHEVSDRKSLLEGIKNNIMEAHSKDRLSSEHYLGLQNEISLADKKYLMIVSSQYWSHPKVI